MFSHVILGSNDLERSRHFYDQVLAILGARPAVAQPNHSGQNRLFYRHGGLSLGITEPIDGLPATVANRSTLGFWCDSPEQVHAFHAAAVQAGGESIEAPPGWREGGMGRLYLAYVRDPDGHKLCALHRPPKA